MSSFPFLTSLLSLCPKVFRWSVLHVGEPGLCGKGSWSGREVGVILDPAYSLQSKHGLHKWKVHAFSQVLPQSFPLVPALEALIPSQAEYPKCMQEELQQFPLWLFPLVLAGHRKRLELGCEILMASRHCALCFCGVVASVLPWQQQEKGAADS